MLFLIICDGYKALFKFNKDDIVNIVFLFFDLRRLMSSDDLLIKEFLIESHEGLSSIKESLMALEKNPFDYELLNTVFRTVHTLKGSATFLGFKNLKDLAHASESVLDSLRQKKYLFNRDFEDVLSEAFDLCFKILKEVEEQKTDSSIDVSVAILKLELLLEMPQSTIPAISPSESKELIITSNDVIIDQIDVAEFSGADFQSEIENTIMNSAEPMVVAETLSVPPNEIVENVDTESKKASVVDSVVKVNVRLLDEIMDMVGELVVNRNQILQYASKLDDFELQKLTHQLDVITSELQNEIMSTRMQPVGQVLNKFERVVRDLSRNQGKKISLVISGQETELDKTLIEAIKDPLTHLIRNAVDHGIENPVDRAQNKKNETALLKLMAFHENGKVSIKIQDDGRGINPEKIKAKAIEKGILTKESIDKMSNKEIVNLIFAPGFSTAEKVTDISGRGVGMDVVKTNIERIGGEIDIETIVNRGTTITLRIPLTLAIIPSLTVLAGGNAFCIPQLNITEFVLLDKAQHKNSLHQMQGVSFFRLREKLVPLYRLTHILDTAKRNKSDDFSDLDLLNIVVVNGDGQEFGIVVDHINDIEEIVVKPLSKSIKDIELYSGATVMGNGEIALILDTSSIIKKINPNKVKSDHKTKDTNIVSLFKNDGARDFLLFSLRDQKKYGIALSFIERIEEVPKASLNFTGGRIFIKYRDEVMPLIDIQREVNSELKLEFNYDMVQVLVVQAQGHLIGLIVNNVYDSVSILKDIDEFANKHPAILGTVFLNEEPVLILNMTPILNTLTKKVPTGIKGKYILHHVDDSKMHRDIFKSIVETEFPEFFEMTSFDLPTSYLDFLTKNKATLSATKNILVTDIDMPGMNGWEMLTKIQQSDLSVNLSILSLTSRDHNEDKERSKELGVISHLKKFNKKEIIQSLQKCMGQSPEVFETKSELKAIKLSNQNRQKIEDQIQYCGFKLGGDFYAVPIMNVQEVVKAQTISAVPCSSEVVRGLINLRGQIVTSINLKSVFEYRDDIKEDYMNIIVRNNDTLASLMVDEILDVMEFEELQKADVPDNVNFHVKKYFDCVYKRPEDLVTILNVHSLLDEVL